MTLQNENNLAGIIKLRPPATPRKLPTISVALLGKITTEQRREATIPAMMKIKTPSPKFQGPDPGIAGE